MLENTLKQLNNVLLLVLLLVAASSSAFATGTNSADKVTGYVTITSSSGDIKRSKAGDILEEGDTITTGKDASVVIILADGSVVNLSELSSYTIGSSENDGLANGDGGTNAYADGEGEKFAPRALGSGSPTLSTATSAGGGITDGNGAPTTPTPGGSPSN